MQWMVSMKINGWGFIQDKRQHKDQAKTDDSKSKLKIGLKF